MATIKTFSLGGLDKKSNDLTRAQDKASEMVNMEYDTQSTLKKRNGYSEVLTSSFNDIIYYGYKDEIIGFTNGASSIKIINNTTYASKTVSFPSGVTPFVACNVSYCESQNNLYFTNADYTSYVMKYDGANLYRSGLLTPRVGNADGDDRYPTFTNTAPGNTRIFYSFKDINGNITYSPYVEIPYATQTSSVLTIDSFKENTNSRENGFLAKFCYRTKTGIQIIDSLNPTLLVTRHNYEVGDKFLMDKENTLISISPSDKSFIVLEVESKTSTSITFTLASMGSYQITLEASTIYAAEYPVDIRSKLHVAVSSNSAYGYYIVDYVLDNGVVTNTRTLDGYEEVLGGTRPSRAMPFEDIYDSTTLKIMPPICKYITSFGSQMAYGSIQSFFTTYSQSVNSPNKKIDYSNNDLIMYSDTSNGDGPEGLSELNRQKIGETWDGEITGLRRCNDSLVIFKTNGVFSIDGYLAQGQYSLRKINTNFIGCTTHKSILESEEGLYFQGHNGIFYTNGINVNKLTFELDSLFLSGSYLNTRCARLKKKQKTLYFVPDIATGSSKFVVVDYYYNQVYMWQLDKFPSSGMIEDSSGNVIFSDGVKLYKFNTSYNDNGIKISSKYSTTWHHAGEPSLNKKWLSVRTFGISDDIFTMNIKTEGNWESGTYLTSNDVTYAASTQTDFKMLDMQTKRSLRLTFSNDILDENMVITGYELTYELFNAIDKN